MLANRKSTDLLTDDINIDLIHTCKQIRKLAKLDRIQLDESTHRSGLNKHLFSYIEYCGLSVKDYIKSYLSNLQPYMLERLQSQQPDKNFVCVLDNMYRVSLYIKVNKTFKEEIIVSFHENNKRGIAKENNLIINKRDSLVPVIAEQIVASIDGSEKDEIKLLIQRGMLCLPITLMGVNHADDIYIVNSRDIETPVIDQCNQYLRDLYTSDLDLEALDHVELFSVLHQISFTSYGNSVFSNITLLIDNMAIQKSVIGKRVADFALITYVDHLLLKDTQAKELMDLLTERYKVSSQKNISIILDRIFDKLKSNCEDAYCIDNSTPIQDSHTFQ